MICKYCHTKMRPRRLVTLHFMAPVNKRGKPLSTLIKQRDIPQGTLARWIELEASIQPIELVRCSYCDEDITSRFTKNNR